MKRVLVLGAGGLLGLNLAIEASAEYALFGSLHQEPLNNAPFKTMQKDLMGADALDEIMDWADADFVINCVALADLEACEQDPKLARQLNAEFAGLVAEATSRHKSGLVHISTDAVFDGQSGNYSEEDKANPQNEYAHSKFKGEQLVINANPDAIVARVNFFGWSLNGTRSLAEFFYNNLKAGQSIKGLTDRFFNPLLVNHLSHILLQMLEREFSGLYHVASPAQLSKYEFGLEIAEHFGFDDKLITPGTSDQINYQAARAPNLTMKVDKLENDLGQDLPDVYSGLEAFHALEQDGYPERLRAMAVAPKIEEVGEQEK
jgi:dTDP-4-dehydrorhamnose reductase